MELPAFLSQKPPPGYIAGVGRGATGFTTRSDIGSGKVPGRVREDRETVLENSDKDEDRDRSNYKGQFEDSNGLSLASTGRGQNQTDEEADRIYQEVDARLSRNSAQRKAAIENTRNTAAASTDASQAFVDLKRSLATVSDEQWSNLPEAGDFTRRNKRQRLELQNELKTYAAPDTLMGDNIDLTKLTQEREKLLGRHLDESLNDGGQDSNHNTDAYLQELDDSIKATEVNSDLQDIPRLRIILNSYRKSDPSKPQGWIASARLEERAKKYRLAKSLIEEGCEACPQDEDIWLENIRLNATDQHYCKVLVARALTFNDESLKLWLKAVELENEKINKVRVVRKALQNIPTSSELWKLAVQYESDRKEAIKILQKATELIPNDIELLTALVNLQEHSDARKTLNSARQKNPNELQIWILATELEEKSGNGSFEKLVKILKKGSQELAKHGAVITFRQWFEEASQVELQFSSIYLTTVRALVKVAIDTCYASESATEILAFIGGVSHNGLAKCYAHRYLLEKEPFRIALWDKFLELGRIAGRSSEVYGAFESVLFGDHGTVLKDFPVLALKYSKEVWKTDKNISQAMDIMNRSIELEPSNVDFWLAKIKLMIADSKFDIVDQLFKTTIESLASQPEYTRVCHRYIGFLRFQRRNQEALELLENKFLAIDEACDKLYLQWGQIYQDLGQPEKARNCYSEGARKLPQSARLWIALARADQELLGQSVKARSDFDLALLKIPDVGPQKEHVLVARVQMERELGNLEQARLLVSHGLRSHPNSPQLWVESLKLLAKKSQRKTAYQDALQRTGSHHTILAAIGADLFADTHYSKALKWFQRAATAAPLFGDAWLWYARCLKRMGQDIAEVLNKVDEHEPRYGVEWIAMAKQPANMALTSSQVLVKCLSSYS
ncbi:LAFA_0F05204g1_1 [Lachancea sp. 'fantastica']|nr:LAFA_0F05204g1_1 [Lachancea sp. 'fantastica']